MQLCPPAGTGRNTGSISLPTKVDVGAATKIINGGDTGLADRVKRYERALKVPKNRIIERYHELRLAWSTPLPGKAGRGVRPAGWVLCFGWLYGQDK